MPVLAWPMMSWPASATGNVIAWMGKGVTIPCSASEATMSGWTSKSAKVSSGATGAGAVSARASVFGGLGRVRGDPRVGGDLVGLGHGHLSIGTSTPPVRELSGA